MRTRYALDASVLASIVNSDDVEHFSCYSLKISGHKTESIWRYAIVSETDIQDAPRASSGTITGTVLSDHFHLLFVPPPSSLPPSAYSTFSLMPQPLF